jgi:DNA-binding CsgD family transcriptional regulator
MRGDFAAARSELEDLAADSNGQLVGSIAVARAELAIWVNDSESARQFARAAAESLTDPEIRLRALRLVLWVDADRASQGPSRGARSGNADWANEAAHALAEARGIFSHAADSAYLGLLVAACENEYSRLCAHARIREWHGLASQWRSLAEAFERAEHPYDAAICRWRAAEAQLNTKLDRRLAAADIRSGWEFADRVAARPLLDAFEQIAKRARIELGTSRTTRDRKLVTARELDVLMLLSLGRTNRDIASSLFISEKTAGVHVSNILGKLGVSNRTEAVSAARRIGLLSSD